MSYQNAQRVPAWKRLGLKLKGAASGESPAPASSANATPTASAPTRLTQSSPASANAGIKRKQPPSAPAPISRGPEKRQRTDAVAAPSPRKSVKFTEDTKVPADKPTEEPKKAPKKPKEKKKKSKPAAEPAEPFNLEPSLAYLRQWHTDRESWKFNKNHQTLVIKYFFDAGKVPAADAPVFLAYIRDLKGFVRTRLRQEAAEIKKKDMADGAAGFAQVKEKADKESKQELYEEVLSKLLLQLGQQQDGEASTATNGNGKRSFDETEFTTEEMDVDVKQRVIKRMRAELVLRELSESEESTASAASGATTTTTSSATQAEAAAEPLAEKRAKLNDGTQQVKRRRLRKSRTADISDDSSSESESDPDSDSDSDSSSSSSDDEEDEEMPLANGEGAAETSSSSSSSDSESEDDSDSDSESGAGAKVGAEGGDSSSEDDSDDE